MKVYIVGEDEATKQIIKQVLNYCSNEFEFLPSPPARGGQIKRMISNFNKLSNRFPVVLLMDLDNEDCAPTVLNKYFKTIKKNNNFIFNIVVDEAEAWLMADRENFASYFSIPIESIPSPRQYRNKKDLYFEMCFPYKSSYFLVKEIIPLSKKKEFKTQMVPQNDAKKGKEYNSALTPFIINHWNIDNAIKNSNSLKRMISRVKKLINN